MHVHLTDWGYVTLGYVVCFGALAVYSIRMLRRGRRLSQALPPEERTWE